jgi:plastocyanin
MRSAVAAVLLGTLVAVLGCRTDQAARRAENIDKVEKPEAAALDPALAGTVSGTVSFKGVPPERLRIDMSQDAECGRAGGVNLAEQYVVGKQGALANVYVYVKAGLPENMRFPARTEKVVLDQKGCRFTPHVIAVQVGESVEVRNSDPTWHNVHTLPQEKKNAAQDIMQMPMAGPQMESFQAPEVMLPVRCNYHPWMEAFINVNATPFFAVTGADGKFEISGLPPGVYTIAAVQEKMGEQTQQVTVASQTASRMKFSFAQ